MVTLTPPCKSNLSQTVSFESNNNNLGDASFSSYLNGANGTFVLKPAESSPNLSSLITTPHKHLYLGRKKVEDGEIDVFGAEKYFNGGMDEENPRIGNKGAIRHQYEKNEPLDIGPVKAKIQPGTPSTAHSESSWNSQSTLLHSVQKRNSPQRKANGRSFLASLGCNCSCTDMDSADVDEHIDENNKCKAIAKEPIKTGLDSVDLAQINKLRLNPRKKFDELGLGLNREDCFSFPVLNSKAPNLAVKMQFQEKEEDKPRKSLEVFGSPVLEKGKKTLSLERRLTMLNWGATPRLEETEITASCDGMLNDTGSDASSDLFEIESFTNNVNVNSFLTRQASDGMPNNNYAPSEASIYRVEYCCHCQCSRFPRHV
uniref:Uncharacterized protein n=1 Tax=Davidia involucrata TaxID=16924 RepID=A0A5B6YJ84_DAVIN